MYLDPYAQDITNQLTELAALHSTNVKGIDALVMQDPNLSLVTKRPWIDEPSGSDPFDQQMGIVLPIVGAGDVIVGSLVCPDGNDGVIKGVSCNVNFGGFVQFSGDIVWRLEIDGRPVKNFDNIISEKGTINFPRLISPIRIYSGQTATWIVNHEANGLLAGQVVCSLSGYFYPSKGIS
jgi:hypothetical protein